MNYLKSKPSGVGGEQEEKGGGGEDREAPAVTVRRELLPITAAELHNRYTTVYIQMSQAKLFF